MATRKVATPRVSPEEARWRARSDADTLAAAEAIKADRRRIDAAKKYAGEEAQRYQKVAKGCK